MPRRETETISRVNYPVGQELTFRKEVMDAARHYLTQLGIGYVTLDWQFGWRESAADDLRVWDFAVLRVTGGPIADLTLRVCQTEVPRQYLVSAAPGY